MNFVTPKNVISISNSLIVLLTIAFTSIIIWAFGFQWAPEALDPSPNVFSAKRAFKHWKQLSVSVPTRHMSTKNYNQSYDYVFSEIQKYQTIANQKNILEVSIEEQRGEIYESDIARIIQVERDARNIIVLIEKKHQEVITEPPIMISAHIDSKNRGPGAYDDAAGIAAMLELLNLIVESSSPPTFPIILLFVGVEELGLQGSALFVKYFKCGKDPLARGCHLNNGEFFQNIASRYIQNSSAFLNIESLGPGMPLGIMQTGFGSAGVITSLKYTKGLIFGTFASDITKFGFITSTSDCVRYYKNYMPGAELLFFGNPTKYHTSLDSISYYSEIEYEKDNDQQKQKEDDNDDSLSGIQKIIKHLNFKSSPVNHLQLLGNALTDFVFKYKIISNNDDDDDDDGDSFSIDSDDINYNEDRKYIDKNSTKQIKVGVHEDDIIVIVGIGIPPYAIVINIIKLGVFGLIASIISLIILFKLGKEKIYRILVAISLELISWILTTLILLGVGSLYYYFNSLVYVRSTIASFNYLLICGFFIFLSILHFFTSPKSPNSKRNILPTTYQESAIFLNSIIIFSIIFLDTSAIFIWQIIFINIARLFVEIFPFISMITNFVGFIYINFTLFLLYSFFARYVSMVPGILGDLLPLAVISIAVFLVALSFLSFIVKTSSETKSKKLIANVKDDKKGLKIEDIKVGPANVGNVKVEPVRVGNVKVEPVRVGNVNVDHVRVGQVKVGETKVGHVSVGSDTHVSNDASLVSGDQSGSKESRHEQVQNSSSEDKSAREAESSGDHQIQSKNDESRSKEEHDRDEAESGNDGAKSEHASVKSVGSAEPAGSEEGSGVSCVFVCAFFVALALLILPLFAPPPYSSESFNIQGDIAHIIDPANGSYVAFAPAARKRVFNGVGHFMKINGRWPNSIETRVQMQMPLMKRDVFMRNASSELPPFIKKWPLFEVSVEKVTITEKEESLNLKNIVVIVPEENPDLIAINLVIDCGNETCIHKINSIGNVNETKEDYWENWVSNEEDLEVNNFEFNDKYGFRYDLRVMPGSQPALFNFTVFDIENIPMKVTFTWDTLTDEATQFLSEFPDFIRPFGRMRSIVDTTLVNYTYI